jgi:hypothetical protein
MTAAVASRGNLAILLVAALLSMTPARAEPPRAKPQAAPGAASQAAEPENLALGKTYTLWPRPNYRHCTDPGDAVQLTDGKTTTAYFWTQTGTVGWQSAPYVVITVDLGRVEPIGGAAMTTAAGRAGVTWPAAVVILTSDDGKSYRKAGDLVALDRKRAGPWPEGYAIRRLLTTELATRGRFVQLVIIPPAGGPYIFTDEIEVFRGPDELLTREPPGELVGSPADLFVHWRTRSAVEQRFDADAAGVERAIRAAGLAAPAEKELLDRLAAARAKLDPDAIEVDASFRAELPLNAAHAGLFAVQAALWEAMGRPTFSACAAATWDPLDPTAPPPTERDGSIEVHAMLGEHRAAAVNLYNAGKRPLDVAVLIWGLPGSPAPEKLVTVHEVAWTDTGRGVPVAAALPWAWINPGGWTVRVLPGLVRQVWFTFHVADLPPGDHKGRVVLIADGGPPQSVPLRLRVYPFAFPEQTTLLVGGWDYSNGGGRYGITPENRRAFLNHLQQRHVNGPWASSSVMMQFRFTAGEPPRVELDTREFDGWIADWPDARAYCVFLALGDHSGAAAARSVAARFGGVEPGTPEFDRRVGAWISAWVAHLKTKNVAPGRLHLLVHDEPHEGTDLGVFLAVARAIRAAEPEVVIWEDPTYREPWKAPAELFDACDVLCPNRPMWLAGGKPFADFYLAQRQRGKTLHFYSCSGPARLLDPYAYYRLQAWEAWRHGGHGSFGSFFWAFGDNSGASSWNEYLAKAGPYTPLFLDPASVTAGKQMEAVRESAQDFETLVMLREAIARAKAAGRNDATVAEAESLLERAAAEVLEADGASAVHWHEAKDRGVADRVRVEVLEAMVRLNETAAPPAP